MQNPRTNSTHTMEHYSTVHDPMLYQNFMKFMGLQSIPVDSAATTRTTDSAATTRTTDSAATTRTDDAGSPMEAETGCKTDTVEEYPTLTHGEMSQLDINWVIKAWKNRIPKLFEQHLKYVLKDRSIGIHFGNLGELPINVTKAYLRETFPTLGPNEISMLKTFRNDFKIDDTILISQGALKSLYVAEVASTYYFQPDPDPEFCQHRLKIKNIRKVPDGFARRYLVQTLSPYNPV
jgi:hypothetical protein